MAKEKNTEVAVEEPKKVAPPKKEIKKDTWKGTVREQAVYHDLNNQKVFAASEEE